MNIYYSVFRPHRRVASCTLHRQALQLDDSSDNEEPALLKRTDADEVLETEGMTEGGEIESQRVASHTLRRQALQVDNSSSNEEPALLKRTDAEEVLETEGMTEGREIEKTSNTSLSLLHGMYS